MKFLVKFAFYGVAYVAGTVSPAVGRKLKAELAKLKAKFEADKAAVVKKL